MVLPLIGWIAKILLGLGGGLGGVNHEDEVPFSGRKFRIPAGSIYEIPLDVKSGWSVEYSFKSDNDINFSIIGRRGAIVERDKLLGDVGKVKVPSGGTYTMLFDNESSMFASKEVTCEYRVVR